MRLRSPIVQRKARIEIIPLIDIMFFLLACFMLVSLSMTQMRGMKVMLPGAATGVPEKKSDFHAITIDVLGNLYLEKETMSREKIIEQVRSLFAANPEARFYIRADENATHGEVVRLLDEIKRTGVQKVSFELKAESVSAPVESAPSSAAQNTPAGTNPAPVPHPAPGSPAAPEAAATVPAAAPQTAPAPANP